METYKGKVAIITGAAGGIGKSLAEQMARKGCAVVMCDVNAEPLEQSAEALTKEGHQAKAIKLDVSDLEAVKKVVQDTASEHGRLDYLFNNAGIGVGGEAYDFSIDDWKNVIDVNLYGVINGVLAAYPLMKKQGHGHIINTASLAGLTPFPGEISYTTSKYAVVGLSHSLRIEAADFGVKVSVVCPGKIETSIYETGKIINFDREKALAMLPKGITPDRCASIILRGVGRNQATIVVTRLAKAMWLAHRISNSLIMFIGKQYIKKMRTVRTEG